MKKLRNIHPGEVLLKEFLLPMGVSVESFANSTNIPVEKVIRLVNGEYTITPDIASKFSKYFLNSSKFWSGLQHDYDQESIF